MDKYITKQKYAEITGGDEQDATEQRLTRASYLLDVRTNADLGSRHDAEDFLYIDTSELNKKQLYALESWVAWLVYAFNENADAPQIEQTVRLGRFQATARDGANEMIPDELRYADEALKASGLIKRFIRTNRNQVVLNKFLDIEADL